MFWYFQTRRLSATSRLVDTDRVFVEVRTRAEVSPNRGLLSRPPLVPYVLVVKSSMGVSADLHSGQICPLSAVRPPRNTAPVPHASKLASGTHKRRCPFWNLYSLPYILPVEPKITRYVYDRHNSKCGHFRRKKKKDLFYENQLNFSYLNPNYINHVFPYL